MHLPARRTTPTRACLGKEIAHLVRPSGKSLGRDLVATLGRLVDFFLQEVVKDGAQDNNGGEHADLIPGGDDGGTENVRGQLELKPDREPAAELEPYPLLRTGGRAAHEGQQGLHRGFDGRQPDDESGTGLDPAALLEGLEHDPEVIAAASTLLSGIRAKFPGGLDQDTLGDLDTILADARALATGRALASASDA